MSSNDQPSQEKWAKVPESIITGRRDDGCLVLFSWLDLRQGARGRPVVGYGRVADELGWQPRTVRDHAHHLAADGWIVLDEGPKKRANKAAVMDVTHNPARDRMSTGAKVTERQRRHHGGHPQYEANVQRESRDVASAEPPETEETPAPVDVPRSARNGADPVQRETRVLVRETHQVQRETRDSSPQRPAENAGRLRSSRSGVRSAAAPLELDGETVRTCSLIEGAFGEGSFAEVDDAPPLPRCACGKVGDRHHDGTPYCALCEPFLAAEAGG